MVAASALAAAISLTPADAEFTRGLNSAISLESPERPTDGTIASGRALYRERCVACHGERGRGDGPAAGGLEPRPADLLLHVPQHTDGELFFFIGRGVPGTAMPAWRSVLTERERWYLVHYLHVLTGGGP